MGDSDTPPWTEPLDDDQSCHADCTWMAVYHHHGDRHESCFCLFMDRAMGRDSRRHGDGSLRPVDRPMESCRYRHGGRHG